MKMNYTLITTAVLCAALTGSVTAADMKIAFVSMQKVFDEYYKTREANKEFKTKADEIELKHDEMVQNLKDLEEEIEAMGEEALDKSLSEKTRDKKKEDVRARLEDYKKAKSKLVEFDENHRKRIRREMHEAQQAIIVELRDIVEKYAKEKGITILLDSSGKTLNNIESVVYYDPSLDITDEIMKLTSKGDKNE